MGRDPILASYPTRIASSVAAVTLAAANVDRMKAYIFNDSTAYLYVKYGSGASSTDFTTRVSPGGTHEAAAYNGIITGAWAAATAGEAAQVTEMISR